MSIPIKPLLIPLFAAALMLVPDRPASALNFNEFSSTVNSTFTGDPFALNRLIAGACMLLFIMFIYAGVRWWQKQTDKAVDEHVDMVKQRHQADLEARKSGKGQKRQWFRLYSPAEFEWLPPHRPIVQGKRPKYKQDCLIDVSAGGIGFTTAEVLEAGDAIKLILYTGEGNPMYLEGHVVRIIPIQESGGLMSSVGVAFNGISEVDRDRMIGWIARRQRDILSTRGYRPPGDSDNNETQPSEYLE